MSISAITAFLDSLDVTGLDHETVIVKQEIREASSNALGVYFNKLTSRLGKGSFATLIKQTIGNKQASLATAPGHSADMLRLSRPHAALPTPSRWDSRYDHKFFAMPPRPCIAG